MGIDRDLLDGELDQAIVLLAEAFAARSIRHALIGGLATSLRGRQRTTQDADFLLEVPQIQLPGLLDDLIERGFSVDAPTVIREFASPPLLLESSASTGSSRSSRSIPALSPTPNRWNGPTGTPFAWRRPRA